MLQFDFKLRDTFLPQRNIDDFYANGNKYDGPRQFGIDWIETDGYPQVNANKSYSINDFECVAYDRYRIEMPERYRRLGRYDVVIHETVHFLQWNTNEDDEAYIDYTGNNYIEYLSQRCELEAHIVQVAYILENMQDYFFQKVPEELQKYFQQTIRSLMKNMNHADAIEILMKSKSIGLL
jgi:hypothetical protein